MDKRLWALDLDGKLPVRAHLLVEHEAEKTADGERLTGGLMACGARYYPVMHGLWSATGENLPLQLASIHCGVPADVLMS